jgi:hypothetical protein
MICLRFPCIFFTRSRHLHSLINPFFGEGKIKDEDEALPCHVALFFIPQRNSKRVINNYKSKMWGPTK